jgi:hypothetical protein
MSVGCTLEARRNSRMVSALISDSENCAGSRLVPVALIFSRLARRELSAVCSVLIILEKS